MKKRAKEPARRLRNPAPARGFPSRLDAVLILSLLVAAIIVGTVYWNEWTGRGNKPVFYQPYFEPAVMIACGHGFVVTRVQPQPLVEFLSTRQDRFSCADISPETPLGHEGLYQGAWRYLLTSVGWYWRLRGISWSGMGPLFGVFFALTIASAYAVCRLGMGYVLAALVALCLTVSTVHLSNLPHLRDYAKAPFVLALVVVLGLLVTRPVRRGVVLGLAVAYGLLLGVGYGFRTDFLANLPVLPIVLFGFLPGGLKRNLALKAAATGAFALVFIVVSWPITSTVVTRGGCQWHVALLGLQAPFDDALQITRAPYDYGYAYVDEYIYRNVAAYATRTRPTPPRIGYCTPEYDAESWKLLRGYVVSFPADFMARALGSVNQVLDLPFAFFNAPMPQWASGLYELRSDVLGPLRGLGKYLTLLAMLVVSGVSVRLGLFLLFFSLYFGGYPAIQFHDRHYFHLEFMTWWALGFLIHQVFRFVTEGRRGWPELQPGWTPIRNGMVFAALAAALVFIPLNLFRWYQQREAIQLLQSYIDAPKEAVLSGNLGAGYHPIPPPAAGALAPQFNTQFLNIDLNLDACAPQQIVRFRYDAAMPTQNYTRSLTIDLPPGASGRFRVFAVVYERFEGLEFEGTPEGCVAGAFRVRDLSPFPILMNAMLSPGWEVRPLYQTIAAWE